MILPEVSKVGYTALKEMEYYEALQKASEHLTLPSGYMLTRVRIEKQNGRDVWIFRFTKASGEHNNFGGEHFSFVVDKLENKLFGFTWMDQIFSQGHLPSKAIKITGMKYKCYCPETHDYAWVIVGSTGKIITFEQGIVWDNGRKTEKWLHDNWLLAN